MLKVVLAFAVRMAAWAARKGAEGSPPRRPLTVERLLKDEQFGVITEYFEDYGYGFIKSPAIHRLCGRDVRFKAWQLLGRRLGETVAFRVELSSDGLPRVAGPVLGEHGRTHVVGATTSPPLAAAAGAPGVNSQGARAFEGRPPGRRPPMGGGGCQGDEVPEALRARGAQLAGTVAEVNGAQGFGVVACEEVRRVYGSDALISRRFLAGLSVGDRISFRLEPGMAGAAGYSGGGFPRPRAVDVRRISTKVLASSHSHPRAEHHWNHAVVDWA